MFLFLDGKFLETYLIVLCGAYCRQNHSPGPYALHPLLRTYPRNKGPDLRQHPKYVRETQKKRLVTMTLD